MDVLIIETKTGKVVATHRITSSALNFRVTEQDYFDSAWEEAVDDDAVDVDRRGDYTFKLTLSK